MKKIKTFIMRLKSIRFIVLLIACLAIISCDSKEESNETPQSEEVVTTQKVEDKLDKPDETKAAASLGENQLKIIGDKVNVRNIASTYESKVLGQLKKGDVYEIKGMSTDLERVGKKTDFWYKIERNGKSCWVFGAFTSKKLSEHPQTTRAVYRGTEEGDYFYIFFEEENEHYLDFGEGANLNKFGDYKILMEEEKYKGKTFDVTWKVVLKTNL